MITTSNFECVVRDMLDTLYQRLGFDLWMVTRTEGNDWIIQQVCDRGSYEITEGSVFNWTDSFCSRMVLGNGPHIAPTAQHIIAYANAPIGRQLTIGAYAGVPLVAKDGTLLGTLCAIHPNPLPESIQDELPLIMSMGKLLSAAIEAERKVHAALRKAERIEAESLKDHLTGVYNRRAWAKFLDCEEHRCVRTGFPACIIVLDLDDLKQVNDTRGHLAGDKYLRKTARAIENALLLRTEDYIARLGGDEFAILCTDCAADTAAGIVERIKARLKGYRIKASIGWAAREPILGLQQAWEEADKAMYVKKTSKINSFDSPLLGQWCGGR
ncbi:MAG: diguanylate cyclase [Elainellaceae cyanobacterium]